MKPTYSLHIAYIKTGFSEQNSVFLCAKDVLLEHEIWPSVIQEPIFWYAKDYLLTHERLSFVTRKTI